jgi:mannosyltransferase
MVRVMKCELPANYGLANARDGHSAGNLGARASAALLTGITLIATFLRYHALTTKQVWFDEALSFSLARLPWPEFLRILWHRDPNMALYFVFLRFWIHLGTTLADLRLLSVVFSIASIPVTYALGARLYGRTVGLLSAWFLALNAFQIRYAQEVRCYAMLTFFSALATWILVRNLQEPRTSGWGVYAAACAGMMNVHVLSALVIPVHALWMFCLPSGEVPWRKVVRSYGWAALGMVPMVLSSIKVGTATVEWIPSIGAETMLTFWRIFAGNFGITLVLLETMAFGVIVVAALRARGDTDGPAFRGSDTLVLAWLFIPVVLLVAISLVKPLFVPRYLISCSPALALAVGAGIVRMRRVVPAFALGVLISMLSVAGTVAYYHDDLDTIRPDWETPSNYVLDRAQPGDGIFFYTADCQIMFDFYRLHRTHTQPWPEPLSRKWKELPDDLPAGATSSMPELIGSRPAGDRVWLVFGFLPTGPGGRSDTEGARLRDWFAQGRQRIDVQKFNAAGIILFARDVNPTPVSDGSDTKNLLITSGSTSRK